MSEGAHVDLMPSAPQMCTLRGALLGGFFVGYTSTCLWGSPEGSCALRSSCVQEPLWLVWQYEGDYTLYDLMQKKDWPYNLEPLLFGRELNLPKSPERRWLSLRTVMKQVYLGQAPLHNSIQCPTALKELLGLAVPYGHATYSHG